MKFYRTFIFALLQILLVNISKANLEYQEVVSFLENIVGEDIHRALDIEYYVYGVQKWWECCNTVIKSDIKTRVAVTAILYLCYLEAEQIRPDKYPIDLVSIIRDHMRIFNYRPYLILLFIDPITASDHQHLLCYIYAKLRQYPDIFPDDSFAIKFLSRRPRSQSI